MHDAGGVTGIKIAEKRQHENSTVNTASDINLYQQAFQYALIISEVNQSHRLINIQLLSDKDVSLFSLCVVVIYYFRQHSADIVLRTEKQKGSFKQS